MGSSGATVQVSNIPLAAVAGEFFEYFEAAVGSVFACEIATARRNWKSRGFGRVQFDSLAAAERACLLAAEGRLPNFQRARLSITRSRDDIVARAAEGRNRVEGAVLRAGVLVGENRMEVFGVWEGVRAEIMPERKKLELFVDQSGEKYKLEVMFGDIIASCGCCLDGSESNAILLQLRSNSVWMFASNENLTAESIRNWMGHFSGIHSVSKCAARMGQLFSSSVQTLNVPRQDVKIIPDIEVTTEDGKKYCFSDGIGKISLSFAKQIAKKCGLRNTPSAFQIRYGGYKGVIAIDRTSFWKLSLRKSMLKFESTNTMLSVTKWSEYLPCFLNREIICLLSTLGVKDEIFESMQHDQMQQLGKMLTDKEVALRVLDRMAGSEVRTAIKMLMQGYDPKSEPYLSMMLKAYRDCQLSDIRSKCRIFVPKGRVLIGCLDETCTLDYGQAYIKVTMTKEELQNEDQTFLKNTDQTSAVVVGQVVVTRNPCLHPGDIRVLQAVYDVGLDDMGLVDCIVFPQKGARPHPNECSGGDLDGDLYFICWDKNLIPPETDTPMDYTPRRPRLMDHDVTLEEIQKFFVDYMINDTLGVISTTHLIYADSEPMKARSPKCLELANLHSEAVDFAKTGAPAEMPRVLRPKEFPDFMERWDRSTFISPGVIGKLYRAASIHFEDLSSDATFSKVSAYDYDLQVEGFEAFLSPAKEYRDRYSEKLSLLMNYYGAEHEDEILTGNLRNKSLYLQKDKKRYGEMKDRMLVGVRSLHQEVEGWFRCSCAERDSSRMASAWYHVTYHPDYQPETTFRSFPWILSDVLLNIKAVKKHQTLDLKGFTRFAMASSNPLAPKQADQESEGSFQNTADMTAFVQNLLLQMRPYMLMVIKLRS
ncbi:RNA-dependent RNA polymerase [Musa troglodytarum]|uniref:RNA-dependent RNA polymerase n=1 Tax=Musa troglodytarum TaxID=320322 RepID=A0A9E7KSN9_9LILI|nr:RNA-dependent RNA polymerase [Musa troglodytarum]